MNLATVHSAVLRSALVALLCYAAAAPIRAESDERVSGDVAAEFDAAELFEKQIAPLLARHCLECHDTATQEGGLDLSRKSSAFAGDSGEVITPGNVSESLLWDYVIHDDMPADRPPLSDEQKDVLRKWIDAGAVWTGDVIDTSAYAGGSVGAYLGVRRLTVPEYIETVRHAVGVDIDQDARRILPPDLRADGFSNTAYNLNVDLGHIQGYAELAEIIVGRMDIRAFASQYTGSDELSDGNVKELVSKMGKWLLRGPLEDHEVDIFLGIARDVKDDGGGFEEAVSCVLEAMLQSPRFLYRIEKQRGDGPARRLDDYELASRLSYIIWGAPPDKELTRAAGAGDLSKRSSVEAQVKRMLEDPRAVERSARFLHEWLNLGRLANLRPNSEKFPDWNGQLAVDMREETLAFFHDVVWEQNRPLSDLMNAEVTYLTPRLADHYDLKPQDAMSAARDSNLSNGVDGALLENRFYDQRVKDGLAVLYTFDEGGGDIVRDLSAGKNPVPLKIADVNAVRWSEAGLTVHSSALLQSDGPPHRLITAVKESGAITLEAWITPADRSQEGPARILTLSGSPNERNFTLGQEGDRFDVRFRSTKTNANGMPSVSSRRNSVETRPTHVVYTRDVTGRAKLYIDGQQHEAGNIDGYLSNWSEEFSLVLGNEVTKDRPWQGTFHLVAIYDRALSAAEVQRNLAAGARRKGPPALTGTSDLLALYTFDAGRGDRVRDISGAGKPINLKIGDSSAVQWSDAGLVVKDSTLIAAFEPPRRLVQDIQRTNAITLEAWVTPADMRQAGPARIVTLSSGIGERNFTLGQDGNRFDVRLRTTQTDGNGIPSMSSPSGTVETEPTHVVYTRDASGQAKLYIDGQQQAAGTIEGDLSNWEDDFRLAVANETTKDRPWRGTLHRVAIFRRALTPEEIRKRGAVMARYDLASVPSRGGLLTHGSVLTVGGDEASMVTRGLFILHDLLYSSVGDPPPCVNTTPVPTAPGLSNRAIAMQRLSDSSCGGCHTKFEPLAFALEKFDGLGSFHEVDEHGNVLREDGEILFPGAAEPVPYETCEEFLDLLAESDRVKMNMTRKVAQFALGRQLVASDEESLKKIHDAAQEDGGTYAAVITAIVLSDLVQMTPTEPSD